MQRQERVEKEEKVEKIEKVEREDDYVKKPVDEDDLDIPAFIRKKMN
jgi:hypothetical protein